MSQLSRILERKHALVLRCEEQRRQLALETARCRAGLQRIDAAAHTVRRLIANPLMGVLFAALAARMGRRRIGKWAGRIALLWRGAKLLGTVAAAARFAPMVLSILNSVRAQGMPYGRSHQWRQASR
jgi:hypothetical protein